MASISIIGMPHAGNPSSPLCAIDGSWPSSGGLCTQCGLRSRGAGRATPMPLRTWPAPYLPRVPHHVLTPSRFFLRPQLLTRRAR
jgi:hypothetical protein